MHIVQDVIVWRHKLNVHGVRVTLTTARYFNREHVNVLTHNSKTATPQKRSYRELDYWGTIAFW